MVKAEIRFEQIKKTAQKLPVKDRARLIEHLMKDEDTWQEEFRRLLGRIDARVKKHPISQKEVDDIVEEAREEYYAKRRR